MAEIEGVLPAAPDATTPESTAITLTPSTPSPPDATTLDPTATTFTPSTPPPPPAAKPPPSVQCLASWLPLYLTRTDRLVAHLQRLLSTPSGTDTTLMALGYSSLAASSLLSLLPLLARARALPTLSRRLAALSALIADVRIFARLWGLLGIWRWGKSVLVDAPPADATQRAIARAQVLVNVLYQGLENGAYLSSKGALGWSAERQNWAWLWSSRFWAAHVGLEFLRLAYEASVGRGKKGEKAVETAEEKAVEKTRLETWRRELVVNLAYAPLTLHWSVDGGLISPLVVGVLGSVVGAINVPRLWRATA